MYRRRFILAFLILATAGCRPDPLPPDGIRATPVYNKQTGKLEQLVSDRNNDGKVETRAFMDGTRLVRIEIDRNGDGRPDRWEYYVPVPVGIAAADSPDGRNMIDRAEEANGATDRITRKESYANGAIRQVEDDVDGDGRADKWETYLGGQLTQVDLDLSGRGKADRRLIYRPSGEISRVEADPDGDGRFETVSVPDAGPAAPKKGGGN